MRDTYTQPKYFNPFLPSATVGDDFFFASVDVSLYSGGLGSDTISYQFAKDGGVWVNLDGGYGRKGAAQGDFYQSIENVRGTIFSDTLIGNREDNTLDGGSGNDDFIASAGNDTIIGGSGFDTISYTGQQGGIVARLDTGVVFKASEEQDSLDSIEGLRATNADDTIFDSDSDTTVQTRGGNDTIIVGKGDNTFDGGTGSDTLDYSEIDMVYGARFGVNVDLGAGTVDKQVTPNLDSTFSGHDTVSNVENVIGTTQNDAFRGSDDADNVFSGLDGDDIFEADDGADVYYGGRGSDTIIVNDSGATVDLSTGTGSGGDAEGDTYVDIENIGLSGDSGTAIGNDQANTLTFEGANHTGFGQDGDDRFVFLSETREGGAPVLDNAIVDGGAGDDTLDFTFSGPNPFIVDGDQSGLMIDMESGTAIASDMLGGTVRFTNMESVIATAGDDMIVDGAGDTTMAGGAGSDVFVFDHDFQGEQDVIRDFEAGVDIIDLRNTNVRNFNDLFNGGDDYIEAVGNNTLIHTGDGNSILLENVALSTLDSGDFII